MRRWTYVLMALAGFAGAFGLMEAAAAAHGNAQPLLQTSANFLLISGTAVIGIAAVALAQLRPLWFLSAASLILAGNLLFCGDLTCRALLQQKLFAFAAPAGGSLMILGWLATGLAAFLACFAIPKDQARSGSAAKAP